MPASDGRCAPSERESFQSGAVRCIMHHMKHTSPTQMPLLETPYAATRERVRLTISVSPEVHATFQRLAAAGSMSISRAMGDWLQDTVEAAEYTATLMEKARAAPKKVMREVHGYALGLADETGSILEKLRRQGGGPEAQRLGAAVPPPASARMRSAPPASNTGGKVPSGKSRRGGK